MTGEPDRVVASPPGRLVDSHAHIYRADMPMLPGSVAAPPKDFGIDAFEKVLDRHGVTFGVIAAPRFLGVYNDATLRAIKGRPRFKATVILDTAIDPYILRAMDAEGVVGVRLSFYEARELPDLTSHAYRVLFQRLADLGWHVHLHVDGPRLPLLLPALTAAPMRLVIDHFGRPGPDGAGSAEFQALLRAFDTGRCWVKLSGAFRLACQAAPLARALLAAGGPNRLLWGSDCPFVGHGDTVTYQGILDEYESWALSVEDRQAIDSAAHELYGFARLTSTRPER